MWVGVILLVLIAGIYIWGKKAPNQNQPVTVFVAPTAPPSVSPSLTPIAESFSHSAVSAPPSPISQITRGQITCNYQTPPAPNQFGSAQITSNWNNANINICVSANGNSQTLIAGDNHLNGSRTDNANWISSNTVYEFTLYNRHPGDPVCSGTTLSTCQINTH